MEHHNVYEEDEEDAVVTASDAPASSDLLWSFLALVAANASRVLW